MILQAVSKSTLAVMARQAMKAEVDLSPKPGLVDKTDNGAHSDMDRELFYRSADAIFPWFEEMIRLTPLEAAPETVLPKIRPAGLEAEKEMLLATGGINTHKGQIFSLGVCLAAARRCLHSDPDSRTLSSRVLQESGRICRGITNELKVSACRQRSHGERLYREKGTLGIRGEAESGFPSVRLAALPRMRELESCGYKREEAALDALIGLYATVEDSTVLHRRGIDGLTLLRQEAHCFLKAGGMINHCAYHHLKEMNTLFISENISPGGCADLIALTFFLRNLEESV